MSCGCCCTNTLSFCKVDACTGEVDLNAIAQSPGEHELITYFNGIRIRITKDFAFGEKLSFPVTGLNENFQFIAEAYDPAGNRIAIKKNNVRYNCFKFQTILTKSYAGI